MAAPVPRNSSPQLSTTSDSDEDEEFDLEKSSFYVEESSRSRQRPPAEPHSPAQWSQLRQLVISDTRSAGTSPASLAPPEILIHIFRLIPATKDLHSALLVSRAWCQCAVELMWHKPHFAKLNSLIKMIHAINHQEQTFQYATFVRRLNFAAQSNELSDQLFSRLAPCIRLERLTLIKCDQLTDEGLMRVFKACPSLIALDLTEVTAVTDQSIEVLAANAPRLQGINVCHCKNITDAGVAALALNCPQLRRIKLHGLVHLTNTPVSILARSCPLLLEIDLNFCTHVSDLAVRELWRHTRLLRELRLSHVNALSDAAFPVPIHASTTSHVFPTTSANATPPTPYNPSRLPPYTIAHQFDHLRTLDLTACHQLTDDALEGIVCNTPKIRQLVLAKCSLLTDDALISISKLGRHLHYLHLGHVTK